MRLLVPFLILAVYTISIAAGTTALPAQEEGKEGRDLFVRMCAHCHDEDAEGDGPDHTAFIPHPANLTLIRDTPEMAFSIVKNGVPGTPMPPFPRISKEAFAQVMEYVKNRPLSTSREWDYPWSLEQIRGGIEKKGSIDEAPALGQSIYVTACLGCHGENGRGDAQWADDPRIWPKPTNFHARSSVPGRLYFIRSQGRNGTMMAPQKDKFPPLALWAVTTYVAKFYDKDSDATIPVPQGNVPSLKNPYSGRNQDVIRTGNETFDLYCAPCHNAEAKGSFLAPKLVDREWRYGGGSDTALFVVIEKGIPGKLMPSHKILDGDRRWKVITFLRHRGGLPDPISAQHGHAERTDRGKEGKKTEKKK